MRDDILTLKEQIDEYETRIVGRSLAPQAQFLDQQEIHKREIISEETYEEDFSIDCEL